MQGHPLTEQILAHWKQTDAFRKSIELRSSEMPFTFFDGPPFTSGDPHYGHLLQSIIKDMVPRRMTMRGYRVERKRGWDCHGIPAENFVNKQLGITSKKQVEELGLMEYIETCRSMVNNVNDKRGWFVDNIGRWVDMENAYFTMNNEYMESVIHLFADLYNKNLIYKGFKVLGYSWALGTPLSNHEINEGYQMRQDPAVTVKLKLGKGKSEEGRAKSEEKYEYTEDGYLEAVMGLVKKDDKLLMMYDIKTGSRWVPGGKVDAGEQNNEALVRELHEEIGISVTDSEYLGAIKIPHGGKLVRLNYYNVEYTGTLENKEPDNVGLLAWISKIENDTELGYAIRVEPLHDESSIIDDQERIENEFQDFELIHNTLYKTPGIAEAPVSLLAWTTTPWTLPSNMFGAVNQDIIYALVYDLNEKEYFVIAENFVSKYYKNSEDYHFLYRLKGKHFLGLGYEPLFDYYYSSEYIQPEYYSQVHKILHAYFVTSESGTGIAHQAPAYGEDDYNMVATHLPREDAKNWLFDPVDQHGDFTDEVPQLAGMNVIEANKEVIKLLKESGKIVKVETIDHSYPHCPRTKTPLIYKAIESRFVKEDQLKAQTVPSTDEQYFVPETVKKRFVNGLASAPDWNISRTRFRGCPLPVWENPNDPEERLIVGSIAEIYEHNKPLGQIEKKGNDYYYVNTGKLVDLHRPYIDDIILVNPVTGNELKRIPEVLDCWFESGSMPYGQMHWMKNGMKSEELRVKNGERDIEDRHPELDSGSREVLSKSRTKDVLTLDSVSSTEGHNYPTADFIAEGLDQTRGWFRALHVLANAYIQKPVYKNVVVTGMILAEDGKKMSKSLQNYPDPSGLINQYGADPLRLYLLSSPVVRAEPLRFNEQGVEQMLKDFVIPLQNVWKFLKTYAQVDNRSHDGTELYFMRHAEATGQLENASLTPTGLYQLEDKKFIEDVLRVNPEIIITSPRERAYDSAVATQKILKKYANKEIEVITSERVVKPGMSEDTVAQAYAEIMKLSQGKRVLIVSHQMRFRIIRQYLFAMQEDIVHNHDQSAPYHLRNTEIVKLPTYRVENELDQWILSELHCMMQELNTGMEAYYLENAAKSLLGFVEKLTNWYVRRSRRRFWATGMSDDKMAAYATLREVLDTFLKCAAPFAPFITEKIWLEMEALRAEKGDLVSSSGGIEGSCEVLTDSLGNTTTLDSSLRCEGQTPKSIHLTYRPLQSDHYINTQLGEEVETVRKIIKGALYLRAKKQIKVKQPLQKLEFTVL